LWKYKNCDFQITLGSETWPVRNENEVALQQAEMRVYRNVLEKADWDD